jgi:GNAT superfamily N-acetyltransferase
VTAANAPVPPPDPTRATTASAGLPAARLRLVPPTTRQSRSVWWARIDRGTDPAEHSLVVVASDRFRGGTAVDLPGARGRRPAGWLVDVRYRSADGTVVRIDLPGEPGGQAGLWFTEVHHAGAAVPAVSLHAWTGGAGAAGEMLPPGAARPGTEHVGVLRWWPRSGLVDTVRVEPGSRGRGVGRALVAAAEGLRLVRGWAPLRADGRLTDVAAAWLSTAPPCWRPRLGGRTHHLPAQPEPGTATGVTRLLADLPTRIV